MQVKKQPQDLKQVRSNAQVAIILANDLPWSSFFEPTLARVGTLPVLLRAILGVQATGSARIIVVFNRITGPQIRQDLSSTRRLPVGIEWMEAAVGTTLSSIVRRATAKSGSARVLLVAGDRTYQPALHRLVSEWDGRSSTLELATGNQPAGLFALSHEAALEFGADDESNVVTLHNLHRWIARKAILNGPSFVDFRCVEEDSWQQISMPQDCFAAEQKLNRWLVKPTDGVFARMNREISIPISRQLIKFPITPNMVSLFTLGVSFAAGAFYALGGYGNTFLGAVLSVWASILDGCDGEVARLKLQASDFGCWLETACDYLYYLFIFAGMTIGLARNSGNRAFWAWGAVLLFGAAVTILLAWFERSRLSGKHPEQFLAVWQKNAESRSSNPLLRMARRLEFIIRRCFLPYPLLAFAVLNLSWLALYMSAIGANIAWIVSLYSRLTFSSKPRAAATRAASETKPLIV
ncbi:MAG: CDP-alcohol phosphatidyltransferase family protein [Terracidiphilus sp.]